MAVGLTLAVLPGSAKAVPSFDGEAEYRVSINSFNGTIKPILTMRARNFYAASPPGDAVSANTGTSWQVPTRTFGGYARANGVAGTEYTSAAAFAGSGFFLTSANDPGFVGLSIEDLAPSLTAEMGGFMLLDFVLAFVPGESPVRPTPDLSGGLIDPADLFAPDDLLFTCSASHLDPTGCDSAAAFDGFAIGPNVTGTLFAVLGLQGAAERIPPDTVPAPSAFGLLGLAVVGLGLAGRRRAIAAA